jgi:alkyl sulfatase BDS1-like metallo-beta-lactamase superfamily hydrolase
LIAFGLAGTSDPEHSATLDETYEFDVDGESFHVDAKHGVVVTRSGPAPAGAALRVACDLKTFLALATGELTPATAVRRGHATIAGELDVFERAFEVLSAGDSADYRLVPA